MNLINKVTQFIIKNNLVEFDSHILVGLSGGPDSVFLLYMLKSISLEYNLSIVAAHLDHEWRSESYKDASFCESLCRNLSIPFIMAKACDITLDRKTESLEDLGRQLRRRFFEKIIKDIKDSRPKFIALGHHADDQEETFFIRLLRGATLTGLASIRPKAGIYIRPLLSIYKHEILQYLKDNNIDYITDITNFSENYLRNRIRNRVIPQLRSVDSRFDQNFYKSIAHIQEAESFLENLTINYLEQIIGERLSINLEELFILDKFIQKRVLRLWLHKNLVQFDLSEKFLEEVIRFLKNKKSNNHVLNLNWSIRKDYPLAYLLII